VGADFTVEGRGAATHSAGMPTALKLVVVAGPDEGAEVALDGCVLVGADSGCTLVLHDPAVSRRHVSIQATAGRVLVQDLGSRNGTFLGDAKVLEAEVTIGAVLKVGDSALTVQPRWYTREVAPSPSRRFGELVGESVAMREIFSVLERVSLSDVAVLVEGESGTGKELAARSIHAASPRSNGPYIVFDCGAVPTELAESELFGHRKGAFSGAIQDRQGAFQAANGGTLCLDEIGELPLALQPKLLRVLEVGQVRPVGDDTARRVDVRVVAATNRDLRAEVHRSRFRADLLYRLEVVKVRMPALRQRPEDIAPLVERLLEGKLPAGDRIGGDNLARLMSYSWPGNVRELRNVLQRAITLAHAPGGPVPRFDQLVINLGPAAQGPATIGVEFPGVSEPLPYKQAKAQLLGAFEQAYVGALMRRCGNDVTKAAAAAGLSRKHLYELLQRIDKGEAPDS
jgi:DNA-binding NtrC family response regulator